MRTIARLTKSKYPYLHSILPDLPKPDNWKMGTTQTLSGESVECLTITYPSFIHPESVFDSWANAGEIIYRETGIKAIVFQIPEGKLLRRWRVESGSLFAEISQLPTKQEEGISWKRIKIFLRNLAHCGFDIRSAWLVSGVICSMNNWRRDRNGY